MLDIEVVISENEERFDTSLVEKGIERSEIINEDTYDYSCAFVVDGIASNALSDDFYIRMQNHHFFFLGKVEVLNTAINHEIKNSSLISIQDLRAVTTPIIYSYFHADTNGTFFKRGIYNKKNNHNEGFTVFTLVQEITEEVMNALFLANFLADNYVNTKNITFCINFKRLKNAVLHYSAAASTSPFYLQPTNQKECIIENEDVSFTTKIPLKVDLSNSDAVLCIVKEIFKKIVCEFGENIVFDGDIDNAFAERFNSTKALFLRYIIDNNGEYKRLK